ncbi:hypothetical protein RDV84_15575 [Lysobacter yananisis]|uniref:Peptidase M10 metallopeptidase domain-containing protein n=1 Tax=Lysobacter yananisis TaxID=1003114 RepID=A0ABY9P503_9GAMM|nr:hypothetical protein [Lysobacter yananisis]WMT01404.1 hypothetical protein RDV84_15575 [Lysobacter yananisis]
MKSNLMMAVAVVFTAFVTSANATPPVIYGKYGARSVTVGFHNSIPADCINATIFAVSEWNAVAADFDLKTKTSSFQPRYADQTPTFDDQNVTIEDGTPGDSNAIMVTRVRRNTQTKIIENTDIIVDKRRINQVGPTPVDKLNCAGLNPTPLDELDFQSSVLHELGHVVGLEDVLDDASCALYRSLNPGVKRRSLCNDEKQAYINSYGKRFQIVSIPNVTGPQQVNIPAQIHYDGTPKFPVQRKTKIIQCPSGWSCDDYNGSYSSTTLSPLTFNFKCTPSASLPTATFKWQTTLTDANGIVTNAVDHTSTCTQPTTSQKVQPNAEQQGSSRIIITN